MSIFILEYKREREKKMNTNLIGMTANQTYADTIRIHYKKDKTHAEQLQEHAARRENPMLDQMLYDADKAEILGEMCEAKNLMLKIARGDDLTEEEKKFLKENYPEYADKAEKAKEQAEKIKEQLKNAKTPEEKQGVIMQAYSMVQGVSEQDMLYGQALGEAVKNVLSEDSKECSLNSKEMQQQDKMHQVAAERLKKYRLEEEQYSLFNTKN